jgi:hypothetical protein
MHNHGAADSEKPKKPVAGPDMEEIKKEEAKYKGSNKSGTVPVSQMLHAWILWT